MRYIFIFFLFFGVISGSILAQDGKAEALMDADEFVEEEIAEVEWLTDKFQQLWEIPQGEAVTVVYQFRNLSKVPIVITQVKASCTCSVSEYTETPIAEGEIGTIKATFDAQEAGPFFKTFMLLTSRSTTPNVLVMQGEVKEQ